VEALQNSAARVWDLVPEQAVFLGGVAVLDRGAVQGSY
jgi:hypothetical protein